MIGTSVSHHLILEKLGEGGMGAVYKARDTRLGRLVALKFLSGDRVDDLSVERFVREAQSASALNHPNIITIYDIGECETGRFIVMELVQGTTLRSLTGRSLDEVWPIGAQVARALSAAHAAGIVHRDIKPENIMVREDGYVKVLDFGLARAAPLAAAGEATVSNMATAPGTLLGTPRYMSPEQARGETATAASDIFSLGVVLYEMAAGRHPFATGSLIETVHALLSTTPVRPSRVRPEITPPLDALLLRMLHKEARLRPNAREVEAALARPGAAVTDVRPPAPPRVSVGREKELAELQSAFDAVAVGRGLMVAVGGEPGIGKSTLVEEFIARLSAGEKRCIVARGRCSERLAGNEAYLPVLEALESLVRGPHGDTAARIMKLVAPTWYVQVAPLTSDDPEFAGVLTQARNASQERMKREFAAFLQEMSAADPVVIFLDDLHWADVSTVDIVAYVGTKLDSLRVLLIGTFRPSDLLLARHPFLAVKLEWQGRGLCREIAVSFLTRDDIAAYLDRQFPENRFPPELPALVHARTEGNALFAVDLVTYLKDRAVIVREDGRWALVQSLPNIEREMPESVRSMIQKKTDQLTDGDRRLLMAASVQGQEFDSAVVARVLDISQTDVEERLESLERAHAFVKLTGDREFPDSTLTLSYSFVHILYQNALYGSLTATRRASLSAAVAGALTDFHGEESGELAAQLAYLFETARDFARASDQYLIAAGNAMRVFAVREAAALATAALTRAEKLKGAARETRVMAAAFALAQAHYAANLCDEAIADFDRAEHAARNLGDQDSQVTAILGKSNMLVMFKRVAEADKETARALKLARLAGSRVGIASAEATVAMVRIVNGEVAEGAQYLERALPVLRAEGPPLIAVGACCQQAWLHAYRLEHEELDELLEWARPEIARIGHAFHHFHSSYIRALSVGNRGRISEGLTHLREMQRDAELNEDRFWLPRIPNALGWLHREVLDLETALRLDLEGVTLGREMESDEALGNSQVNLGHDYLALGELARAWEHLEEAGRTYDRDAWTRWRYNIRLLAERAGYWIARGDLTQATLCASQSLERAKATLSRKHWAWGHKLLGDIAVLKDGLTDSRGHYDRALSILDGYPCPTIEWQILLAAADAARRLHDNAAADSYRARARCVLQGLADSITETPLRERFLAAKPIRDL